MKQQKSAVVAFAFGSPFTLSSNKEIARVASEIAEDVGCPVFTQELVPVTPGRDIRHVIEPENDYFASTFSIAQQAISWADGADVKRLYVVAAHVHIRRCMRDLRWIALRKWSNIVFLSRPVKVSWQEGSWQKRVRSPWQWYPREYLLRALPMWLYERVTSTE